jgi:glutamyl-tRNA synthetase
MDLIARKKAYYCFDTQAELDAERDAAVAAKRPYVYSRKALSLSDDVVQQYLNAGRPYTIRFKMPDSGTLFYTDLIRGEMRFDLALVGDFVIMKSDGTPAYNFAVAVDDRDMQVTHVIRGEDHISNMPRQLCIYDALGASWPQFAHMPMILGPDKAKLSKRHGATNVIEYKTKGILSDALFNYLSLLGWSPEGEDEILTRSEITDQFSLNRVSRSNAIFDMQKLSWMNGQYIRQLSSDALQHHLYPYLTPETEQGLSNYPEDVQQHALRSIQDNLSDLTQVNTYLEVYVMRQTQYTSQVNALTFKPEELACLRQLIVVFEGLSSWTSATLNDAVEGFMKVQNLGKGKVLRPLRLAVTSVMTGPYVIDIIDVFGRDKTLQRLNHVVTFH